MDAKKEDMMGGMTGGMTGGMMDDMMGGMMSDLMGGHTPQSLLAKLAASEQMEAALYTQIAQCVPSAELCRIIMHKAMQERRMAERLAMLSQFFGMMPADPPGVPMPYSAGESKEKK